MLIFYLNKDAQLVLLELLKNVYNIIQFHIVSFLLQLDAPVTPLTTSQTFLFMKPAPASHWCIFYFVYA